MVLGLFVGGSGLAEALSWQTTPVLGTSTDYNGDVLVYTDSGVVIIPEEGGINNPWSMTLFHVGETVDAGSGIYYAVEGNTYHWSVTYTGPSRNVVGGEGDYPGDSGEGFVLNYLDPLGTLLPTDVGIWNYTETWTDLSGNEGRLSYSVDFTVASIPEPATMLLLGLGLVGLAGVRRKFKS